MTLLWWKKDKQKQLQQALENVYRIASGYCEHNKEFRKGTFARACAIDIMNEVRKVLDPEEPLIPESQK